MRDDSSEHASDAKDRTVRGTTTRSGGLNADTVPEGSAYDL